MLRILKQSRCTDAQKEIQGDKQALNISNFLILPALVLIPCLSTYRETHKAQVNKCTLARWDVSLAGRKKGWWKYQVANVVGLMIFNKCHVYWLLLIIITSKKHRKLLNIFSYQQSYVQKIETLLAFSAGLFSKYVQMRTCVHPEFFSKELDYYWIALNLSWEPILCQALF